MNLVGSFLNYVHRLLPVTAAGILSTFTLTVIRSQMPEGVRWILYVLCVLSAWDLKRNITFLHEEVNHLWQMGIVSIV